MKYTCPLCKDDSLEQSDMTPYTDMCVACACDKFGQDLEIKWEKELKKFAKRTGKVLDFNDFYNASYNGEINIKDLKGLPELRECYSRACGDLAHAKYEASLPPELNFSGLPF